MRHRIALALHGWSLKIGGPLFALAIRQAVIQQLQFERAAAACAAVGAQAQRLERHRQRVAGIAQSN